METLVKKLAYVVEEFFGVSYSEMIGSGRMQNVADARSAFIYAIYSAGISGPKISPFFKCTTRAMYYHLSKFEDMKCNRIFQPLITQFEKEIEKIIEIWQAEKQY